MKEKRGEKAVTFRVVSRQSSQQGTTLLGLSANEIVPFNSASQYVFWTS